MFKAHRSSCDHADPLSRPQVFMEDHLFLVSGGNSIHQSLKRSGQRWAVHPALGSQLRRSCSFPPPYSSGTDFFQPSLVPVQSHVVPRPISKNSKDRGYLRTLVSCSFLSLNRRCPEQMRVLLGPSLISCFFFNPTFSTQEFYLPLPPSLFHLFALPNLRRD